MRKTPLQFSWSLCLRFMRRRKKTPRNLLSLEMKSKMRGKHKNRSSKKKREDGWSRKVLNKASKSKKTHSLRTSLSAKGVDLQMCWRTPINWRNRRETEVQKSTLVNKRKSYRVMLLRKPWLNFKRTGARCQQMSSISKMSS
jgi:hypothetical protein